MPLLLTVEGLAARRGEDYVFRDISVTLQAGEALVVTGPNGSGKSTFLRAVAGLLKPDLGRSPPPAPTARSSASRNSATISAIATR